VGWEWVRGNAARRPGHQPGARVDDGFFMPLRIYPVILELVRQLTPVIHILRTCSPSLADQLERALVSVPLNVAEGSYSRGKNRQARFQSATASAHESLACIETAQALRYLRMLDPETEKLFRQVIGTLVRLVEPRPKVG
jgi:four helix bundle protein